MISVLFLLVRHGKITWIFFGAIIALVCLSPHFLLRADGDFKPQHMELGWSVKNFFQSSFQSTEGFRTYRLPNLLYALGDFYHPGYLFAGVFVLPFLRLKDLKGTFVKILLAGVLIYIIFIAGMAYQNQRFLVISFPLVLLVLYPSFSRLWENHCPKWMQNLVWIGILIIQSGLFVYGFNPILKRQQFEKKVVRLVEDHEASTIYSFDVDQALKSYRVDAKVLSLWEQEYDHFEPGALVVFNKEGLSNQWEGEHPMINWYKLEAAQLVTPLDTIENGWVIYRISDQNDSQK